jgi:hypothetical protein
MATLATVPELALPGKTLQLVFTAEASGNFVKVWCTSAPRGSKLRKQLDDTHAERVLVISESDINKRPEYSFDKGGVYVLQVEEFQKGAAAYGGRYRGDPDGYQTEDRLATPTTSSLWVATLLETELGVAPNTATLQLYVSNDSIVQTTVATHGVASPMIAKTATDKARNAADAAPVQVAIAALDDIAAVTAIGTLSTIVDDWIDNFNNHLQDLAPEVSHYQSDFANLIGVAYRGATTLQALVRTLGECVKRFGNHITNIDPAASNPVPGSGNYHQVSGVILSDWTSALLTSGGASAIGACCIVIADLHRCFEAHRVSAVHIAPDTTHALADLPAILALHAAFLAELSSLSPTTPDNEHSAKVLLVGSGGFKEV